MLRFLLFAFIAPVFAFSQNTDPRIPQHAPAPDVKSVSIVTVRYIDQIFREHRDIGPPGLDTIITNGNDTTFGDTALLETKYYSRDGKIDSTHYFFTFPQYAYYYHKSDSEWVRVDTCEFGFDTITIKGNNAAGKYYFSDQLMYVYYEGDSVKSWIYNMDGKIGYHHEDVSSKMDTAWDYRHVGLYADRVIGHGKGIDTIRYYNQEGNWMIIIVNHYDKAGRPVRSEYYSSIWYFCLVDMEEIDTDQSIYAWINGDSVSCTVKRVYDKRGFLLREEYWWPWSKKAYTIRYYTYQFYEKPKRGK